MPFFLETGQNLALQIANDPRLQGPNADVSAVFNERSQSVPYFSQLVVFDMPTQTMLASYPSEPAFQITRPEEEGITLAQQGVPNQVYSVPPLVEGEAAGVSFLAAIPQTEQVLIGRTYLGENPYTRSLINNLNSLSGVNGTGMLIADGIIVYHSDATQTWTTYEGITTTSLLSLTRPPRLELASWSIINRYLVIPGQSCSPSLRRKHNNFPSISPCQFH